MRLETFAGQVLAARDLDPVVYTVRRAILSREMTEAFLTAYWILLDPGPACFVAEDRCRWAALKTVIATEAKPNGDPWPRVRLRCRLRGPVAERFLDDLRRRCGSLPGVARRLTASGPKHARDVIREARFLGFDRATADLVAVQLRKILDQPLRFGEAWALRGPETRAAARLLWEEAGIEPRERDPRVWLRYALARLRRAFGPRMLPQDAAAVLRRWRLAREGRYEIGEETRRLKESLEAWVPYATLASRMLNALPRRGSDEVSPDR